MNRDHPDWPEFMAWSKAKHNQAEFDAWWDSRPLGPQQVAYYTHKETAFAAWCAAKGLEEPRNIEDPPRDFVAEMRAMPSETWANIATITLTYTPHPGGTVREVWRPSLDGAGVVCWTIGPSLPAHSRAHLLDHMVRLDAQHALNIAIDYYPAPDLSRDL